MDAVVRRTLACSLVAAAAGAPLAAQNVSVGGVIYAQYVAQLDSAPPGANSNFDVTRAYLNVIGKFSGGIGSRLTGDIYRNADGSHAFRLKYAFASWTPEGSALTYKFGLTQTPFLDWEEALWDYRMQGPMAVDRNDYMSAADFGAAVDGAFTGDRVNFTAGVYNGEKYSGSGGDQHKDFEGRLSVRVLDTDDGSRVGGLRLTGYAQLGKPTSGGTRNRFIGMVSYRSSALTLAGEYVATVDSTTGFTPAGARPRDKGSIVSAFSVYHVPSSRFAIIARVDLVDPNTADNSAATSNDRRTTIIGGVSYQLSPNVRLLADVDHTTLQGDVTGGGIAPRKLTTVGFKTQFTF